GLDQTGRRSKSLTKLLLQTAKTSDDLRRSLRIDMIEGAAQEGRKPEPKDSANVSVARALQDPLTETMSGFVHHRKQTALGNASGAFWGGGARSLWFWHRQPKIRVDGLIHRALPCLLLLVAVKALLVLST